MPEIRSTDQPDELGTDRDNLAPRPCALNLPDWRADPFEKEAVRQSPPPRAIRPISSDCNDREERAPSPLRIRPSRGSNLLSSSAIHEDMRQPDKRLKYLAGDRRKSAAACVEEAAQSRSGVDRR